MKGGDKIPKTTLFVSANLTRTEVERKLSSAVRSKIVLIHTGERSLQHENVSELCSEIIEAAKELHNYLPSLVGLGMYLTTPFCKACLRESIGHLVDSCLYESHLYL